MAASISILRKSTARALQSAASSFSSHNVSPFTRRCPLTSTSTSRSIITSCSVGPLSQRRCYSDSKGEPEAPLGPNQNQLPHVTEEANEVSEIMGEEPIDVDEVATPLNEVIEREGDVENAPEIIKEDIKTSSFASTDLSSLTSDIAALTAEFPNPTSKVIVPPYRPAVPILPIPALHSINHRQHPLLRQLTPHFMESGKATTAQNTVQKILQILRTKPAPRVGKYPLVPNSPDLSLLPGDPIAYLQTAIDSVAPLFKMKSTRGSGGSTVQIPAPLPVKVRRRRAMEWIMQAADGKKRVKSLPERFAEEIEAVVLGTSSCWEKRSAIHKLAVTNRANVGSGMGARKGKKKF